MKMTDKDTPPFRLAQGLPVGARIVCIEKYGAIVIKRLKQAASDESTDFNRLQIHRL